jgi:hypothetical protein
MEIKEVSLVTTWPTATNGPSGPDSAKSQTAAVDTTFAPGSFTERGQDAETAAFINDGMYSGGWFAAGPEST